MLVGGVQMPQLPSAASPVAAAETTLSASAQMLDSSVATMKTSSQSYQGAVAIKVGEPYPVGRGIAVNCTQPGNVTVTMADGSALTFQVAAGFSIYDLATTEVIAPPSPASATATFYNMT